MEFSNATNWAGQLKDRTRQGRAEAGLAYAKWLTKADGERQNRPDEFAVAMTNLVREALEKLGTEEARSWLSQAEARLDSLEKRYPVRSAPGPALPVLSVDDVLREAKKYLENGDYPNASNRFAVVLKKD